MTEKGKAQEGWLESQRYMGVRKLWGAQAEARATKKELWVRDGWDFRVLLSLQIL